MVSREAILKKQYRIDDSATLSTRDVVDVEDIEDEPPVTQKSETVTEFADRCRECGAKYGELLKQKSGKWIRWREEIQRGTHYMENVPHCKCSECDTEYDTYASRFINYCPNCGVKMESEENE